MGSRCECSACVRHALAFWTHNLNTVHLSTCECVQTLAMQCSSSTLFRRTLRFPWKHAGYSNCCMFLGRLLVIANCCIVLQLVLKIARCSARLLLACRYLATMFTTMLLLEDNWRPMLPVPLIMRRHWLARQKIMSLWNHLHFVLGLWMSHGTCYGYRG